MTEQDARKKMALDGVKVIEVGEFQSGPFVGALMADFGADVIKVEHPSGDRMRNYGWQKNGVSMWWLLFGRNKRCITLDLSTLKGQQLLKELAVDADVLIENFRPGTLQNWGLDYETLRDLNRRLVYLSASSYGQTGPYRDRAAADAIGDAMSGFAHLTGEADGSPQLSQFGLADQVAGVFGTMGVMFALYNRDARKTGQGQHIDLSLYEPLLSICGPQAAAFDQLGIVATRNGNRMPISAPRNNYKAKDGKWVAVSSASLVSATRMLQGVGHGELAEQPWFQTAEGRVQHVEEIDDAVGGWIGEHLREEVIGTFEQFEAVAAPIYSIADGFADPQFIARNSIATVPDRRLGQVRVQNVTPRLSGTPGEIRHMGPELGEHNHQIYVELLGHSQQELDQWRRDGII